MSIINETNDFVNEIYQLETTDRAIGGIDGVSNRQAQQLANRTKFLRNEIRKQTEYRTVKWQNENVVVETIKIGKKTGVIKFVESGKIPNGYLLCDGSTINNNIEALNNLAEFLTNDRNIAQFKLPDIQLNNNLQAIIAI